MIDGAVLQRPSFQNNVGDEWLPDESQARRHDRTTFIYCNAFEDIFIHRRSIFVTVAISVLFSVAISISDSGVY